LREEDMKICSKCKQLKELSQFSKDKYRSDGLCSQCRECRSVRKKEKKRETEKLKKENTLPKGKILCEKNNTIIREEDCILDCNDICRICKSRQEGNMRAGGEILSKEEEAIVRYEGVLSLNYTEMIAPYAER
jgi:hypothetical protein